MRCKYFWSHGTSRAKGVALAFKRGLKYCLNKIATDNNGLFILAEITVNEKMFCLVNIYRLNIDSPDFCLHLFNQIQNVSFYEVILGGDFNLVLNNDLDKLGGSPQHSNYKASSAVNAHICRQWDYVIFVVLCTRIKNVY